MLGEPSEQNRAYFPEGEEEERQKINIMCTLLEAIVENKTEGG